MARNGHLSYINNGTTNSMDIYIEKVAQPFGVSGISIQTRLSNQWYPRGNAIGNMTITARATNQDEYQSFSRFVREHQLTMINTSGIAFTNATTTSTGYRRLLGLTIDNELISLRGWIPQFTMIKQGILSFAPQFQFQFYVVFDDHSVSISTSAALAKTYWNSANAKASTKSPPPQIHLPGVFNAGIVK